MGVRSPVQEAAMIKTIPKKKKASQAKWLPKETLDPIMSMKMQQWLENVQQTEVQDLMASQITSHVEKRVNTYPFETPSKRMKRKKYSQGHFMRPTSP